MLVLNLLVVIGQLNPLGLGSYLIIDGCNWKLRPTHGHTLLRPQSDMETSSGALSTVQLAISINDTSHLLIGRDIYLSWTVNQLCSHRFVYHYEAFLVPLHDLDHESAITCLLGLH